MNTSDNQKINSLASVFMGMSEADFTKEIVMPYLNLAGFKKITYNNGPTEKGKDIIFSKDNEFGREETYAAQVKAVKINSNTSSQASLQQLIAQANVAFLEGVPLSNGTKQKITKLIFFSSYPVDTRQLESCSDGFRDLTNKGMLVIDGNELAALIYDKYPDFYAKITGRHISSGSYLSKNPTNYPLLCALKSDATICIDEIYNDLDFSVGGSSGRILLSASISNRLPVSFECNPTTWSSIKNQFADLVKNCYSCFQKNAISSIEDEYERLYKTYSSDENIELIRKEDEYARKISESAANLIREADTILQKDINTGAYDKIMEDYVDFARAIKLNCNKIDHTEKLETLVDLKEAFSKVLLLLPGSRNDVTHPVTIKRALQTISYVESLIDEYIKLSDKICREPNYNISIDCHDLSNDLRFAQTTYTEAVQKINNGNVGDSLNNILDQARSALVFMLSLESFDFIHGKIGLSLSSTTKHDGILIEGPNLFALLSCGEHVAIIGDAGSGKSTTLEHFAKRLELQVADHEMVIFLPLSKIKIDNQILRDLYELKNPAQKQEKSFSAVCEAISKIYKNAGIDATGISLESLLVSREKIHFIIDGFDEFEGPPQILLWFLRYIETKGISYHAIWSSRFRVLDFADIAAIEINLLPFNEKSLNKFIRIWMKDKPDKLNEVISHLKDNPELAEVIKNPLMATICCVLSNHGVKIPNNHGSLYEERFKLLYGHYDVSKGIKRCKSTEQVLDYVARKIAYLFHSRKIRQSSTSEIMQYFVVGSVSHKFDIDTITKAVEELIDPCTILIKMDHKNSYGFGHLTYQEYLTAKELQANRGVNVVPLLKDKWWFEVAYFFGMITDDVSNVIEQAIDSSYGHTSIYKKGIMKLIASKRKDERMSLLSILKKHEEIDAIDYTVDFNSQADDWLY